MYGRWKEIDSKTLTLEMVMGVKDKEDYLLSSSLPETFRLFVYKDCYAVLDTEWKEFSIINLGMGINFACCTEPMKAMCDEYGEISFTWVSGIRNEVFIKRLLRNFKIVYKDVYNGMATVSFINK